MRYARGDIAEEGAVVDQGPLAGVHTGRLAGNPPQWLLKTYEHGLLICSGDLDPRALVTLPGCGSDSGLDLVSVLGTASGTFAAELAGHATTLATVWRLTHLPGC